ncbi:MAG: hypothetical protein A2979_00380 [Deltaproteobacteria bacterium RIFCSPLOWO2_01_FULL_45_74]|nr:MAG: hypothetical protein A2712_10005 [Deltaproteobacteria bacterium RIFCSPHIGHO2_01_FULL_43_49]OGQ15443.1 MAG: hypothetical protein A3D22_10535 [Deltaproteobacteria bacterium RIFCSPHIGHO2_02_FULL_44_53]OGQ29636.1 MAG: hypothetical protein A3D98_10735 [Deltaproteobacteria bacterium RIFCSPHIGHO2_12_FULL_44_21]OGQ32249.1 MAG: hypothetical protein A2979_00380 [Deltaproteobacteria bacterium RIFCSPLOWO2_01_FULL_45_74]OGQ43891.1 MAG: hypothetical protein A3I70_04275 [Deltaproteobacteria bacterium 
MVLGFGRKKILIVEDNPDQLTILKSVLEKQGFKIITATDGEEAVDRSKDETPDLILMDINMPGLRGDMAALRIRGDATTKDIPIIMLTAVDDVQEKVLASQTGAVDYITKPYKPEELLAKIKAHI